MPAYPRAVVAAVPDLFFASKIGETARQAGMPIVFVQTKEALLAKALEAPEQILIDLSAAGLDPIGAIEELKRNDATKAVPLRAFANHERTDLIEQARAAGCDQVFTRGAFSSALPLLLQKPAG